MLRSTSKLVRDAIILGGTLGCESLHISNSNSWPIQSIARNAQSPLMYLVATLVIERPSGQSYADFVRVIFRPALS